jgi:gluconolactonase
MSSIREYDTVDDQARPAGRELQNRRRFLGRVGAAGLGAGALAIGARSALAQEAMGPVAPPSTVTSPPREFGPNGAPNVYFWDADVIAVDPSFNGLAQPNAPIQRLWTGALWAEGPAWNSVGKFLVFSDIPNNRQMRWIEDDGHVSVFRFPSNNSNGNTFDFQGRQISCEHLMRRVVRYELDGSVTVLADSFEGKRLNSPTMRYPIPTAASGLPTHRTAA